jgi:hypothetical protein
VPVVVPVVVLVAVPVVVLPVVVPVVVGGVVPGTVTVIDGDENAPPRAKSVYVALLADTGKVTNIVFSDAGAAVVPMTTESGE